MKSLNSTKTILLVFFLQLSTLANASETYIHNTLNFPPYWTIQQKKITGFHADLVREIYRKAKLDVKITEIPYARISKLNLDKKVAFIAYGSNPKTNHKLLFPLPMTTIHLKIYSLRDNPPTNMVELIGKKVAIKRGYPLGTFAPILKNKSIKLTQTNTVSQGIKMLLAARVDFFITLDDPYNEIIEDLNKKKMTIFNRKLMNLEGWPIAILKTHPKAKELHKTIQNVYIELKDQGVIKYENNKLLLSKDRY